MCCACCGRHAKKCLSNLTSSSLQIKDFALDMTAVFANAKRYHKHDALLHHDACVLLRVLQALLPELENTSGMPLGETSANHAR